MDDALTVDDIAELFSLIDRYRTEMHALPQSPIPAGQYDQVLEAATDVWRRMYAEIEQRFGRAVRDEISDLINETDSWLIPKKA